MISRLDASPSRIPEGYSSSLFDLLDLDLLEFFNDPPFCKYIL